MALINCKECKGKISTEAESCPHCDCKDPVPAKCIACGGWIYDESKPCPNCGDPNLQHAKDTTESSDTAAKSGSTVECRKCGKAVSPNAEVCPHCNCTEPIIEPLPFVKCREKDCGSIIHKEAKHCPNCGCKDPAPSDASTLKSNDYADAVYLVKQKGEKPERFTTYEIIDKIKIGEILPQQQITIDVPDEYQHWRPAYYYLPFAEYEDYDAGAEKAAAAEKAGAEKAAAEKVAAAKAAVEKAEEAEEAEEAEKKLRRKLLYACTPTLFLYGSGTAILLVKFFLSDFSKQLLGIDHLDSVYPILCGAVAFSLALNIVLFDPWRSRVAAYILFAWCYITMFSVPFTGFFFPRELIDTPFLWIFFLPLIINTLVLLPYAIRIIKQLQEIEDRKIDDGTASGRLGRKSM